MKKNRRLFFPLPCQLSKNTLIFVFICLMAISCQREKDPSEILDSLAEQYVKLSLKVGAYIPDFIDAYYGPSEWKPSKQNTNSEIPSSFIQEISELVQRFDTIPIPNSYEEIARFEMLRKQCLAMEAKAQMVLGKKLSFDEEAEVLYDADPPHHDSSVFDSLLIDLDHLIPGSGPLNERFERFVNQFIIPIEKLDTVFKVAIKEARRRTIAHFDLPADEHFEIQYVTGKSWSGYNYYQGNSYSIIQINTDLPIYIERAIDLACHEGYPGHHVYNTLLEKNLARDKGWVEFSLYPLFSPQSFIAEGSANYGIDLAFPRNEKADFEKEVLFPLADLDSSQAVLYNKILTLRSKLNYAGNEAARAYLDGQINQEEAAGLLEKYLLYEPSRAMQRIHFIDQYRSYVINYNLGRDVIANFIRQEAGMDYEQRWQVFGHLLSNPITASIIRGNEW